VKVAVEQLEACKRRLAVEAPADVVQKEWERAYGRVQKQARLPGFRKGHVPRSLVKLHFADDVRREVAEHLIPDVYRQALTEAQLDPVNEPDLTEVKLEENSPLSFVAVVEVKPAIALGEYKGVEVQHAPSPVTDEQVAELRALVGRHLAETGSAVAADLLGGWADAVAEFTAVVPRQWRRVREAMRFAELAGRNVGTAVMEVASA